MWYGLGGAYLAPKSNHPTDSLSCRGCLNKIIMEDLSVCFTEPVVIDFDVFSLWLEGLSGIFFSLIHAYSFLHESSYKLAILVDYMDA